MVVQVEKMQAHSPMEKAAATEKKEERLTQAEINKLDAMKQNAAARHNSPQVGGSNPGFTAATASPASGVQQMSAMPGHGTGQPTGGYVAEGVVESHPIGLDSGTGQTMAHNTRAGGNPPGPYHSTGGTYN